MAVKRATLSFSSTTMVSAIFLPISGRPVSAISSRRAMAAATSANGRCNARSALRLPMPFTVVNSSKKSRSSALRKPISRGQKLLP